MNAQDIRNEVAKIMGEGYAVGVERVTKNNGIVLEGITIKALGEKVAPIIYIGDIEDADTPASVADEIIRAYHKSSKDRIDVVNIMAILKDPERLKASVLPKLTARQVNNNVIYPFLDMDVRFYIPVDTSENTTASVTLTQEHLALTGLTAEELFEAARRNLKTTTFRIPGAPFEALTTEAKSFGAAAMLDTARLEGLAEYHGDDLYILPSSIHECLILPAFMVNVEDMRMLVQTVNGNRDVIDPTEVLTGSVYRYDRKTREITIA